MIEKFAYPRARPVIGKNQTYTAHAQDGNW
jgi:hypothetical protein